MIISKSKLQRKKDICDNMRTYLYTRELSESNRKQIKQNITKIETEIDTLESIYIALTFGLIIFVVAISMAILGR